jgi:hypothetical protein
MSQSAHLGYGSSRYAQTSRYAQYIAQKQHSTTTTTTTVEESKRAEPEPAHPLSKEEITLDDSTTHAAVPTTHTVPADLEDLLDATINSMHK